MDDVAQLQPPLSPLTDDDMPVEAMHWTLAER